MPYKSQSQVRAFYAKERRGELPEGTAEHWSHETPNIKALPERLHPLKKKKKKKHMHKAAFWRGFLKAAEGADGGMGDGGNGFTGVGKGNIIGQLEHDEYSGTKPAYDGKPGDAGSSDGLTDHTLLDRERNPRDFSPFQLGPTLEDENGTKIVY